MTNSFSSNIQTANQPELPFYAHGPDITDQEMRKMGKAMKEVFELMKDGQWRTVDQIGANISSMSPPQSITIYLRAFREKRYGGHSVNKKKVGNGRIFAYQVIAKNL